MNTLRIDFINKRAPYLVKENPHAVNSYVFKTDTDNVTEGRFFCYTYHLSVVKFLALLTE